jgi:hypothetical protein
MEKFPSQTVKSPKIPKGFRNKYNNPDKNSLSAEDKKATKKIRKSANCKITRRTGRKF